MTLFSLTAVIQPQTAAFRSFMRLVKLRQLGCLAVLVFGLPVSAAWADAVSAVQLLRVSGCAGTRPAMQRLQPDRQLDRAAALWAAGDSLETATAHSGYPARMAVGLRLRGSDDAILQSLRQTRCHPMEDQSLRELGVYRRGPETWLLLASMRADGAPAVSAAPQWSADIQALRPWTASPDVAHAPDYQPPSQLAPRVLTLVNEVRASGTHCGGRPFKPAPPLRLSGTLDGVASEHARDMALRGYFEHVDLTGRSPADRVRATGYREKLVGDNIAYGPTSADEVVAGWLHSTGHCENIMDPRFVEMGLAQAPGQGARHGLYWDQVLATPVP